jgi:hypothetical protein
MFILSYRLEETRGLEMGQKASTRDVVQASVVVTTKCTKVHTNKMMRTCACCTVEMLLKEAQAFLHSAVDPDWVRRVDYTSGAAITMNGHGPCGS